MTDDTHADITGVESKNIPLIWEEVEPLVEQALMHSMGEYTVQDIYSLLMYHKMQLWIAATNTSLKGIMITEIISYPRKTVLQVVLVAGMQIEGWEHLLDVVENWAYSEDCDFVRAFGRVGWKQKAKAHGYDLSYTLYSKVLRAGNENTH